MENCEALTEPFKCEPQPWESWDRVGLDGRRLSLEDAGNLAALSFYQGRYQALHAFNKSDLESVLGYHRSGKSLYGTAESVIMDSTFWKYMEKRIVYYGEDFNASIDDLADHEIHGGATLFDECGIGLYARNWFEEKQKQINYVLQTAGHLNPLIIFVTQDSAFLDNHAKKLLTHFTMMDRPGNKYSTASVYNVEINRRTGKVKTPHPRVVLDGELYRLERIKLPLPPKRLIDRYIKHSDSFKKAVRKGASDFMDFSTSEKQKKQQEKTIRDVINEVYKGFSLYLAPQSKPDRVRLDADLISYEHKISAAMARQVKKKLEGVINSELDVKRKAIQEAGK